MIEETIKGRIAELIAQAQSLRSGNEYDQVRSGQHLQECSGWMASAWNVVQQVCGNSENAYRKRVEQLATEPADLMIHSAVGEVAEMLRNLSHDVEAGLISTIIDRAAAATFDDFLDHAKAYLGEGMVREAGVIAGVVFEDSLRRISRKYAIVEKDRKLDELIAELQKKEVLTPAKAKRARVAAHVRTKATHAQWEEFDAGDVKATIDLAEELILERLDK